MEKKADIILKNGIIQTMIGDETAEAIAIIGDEIAYVGSNAEVEAFAGPETKTIDLDGRMVTPGFVDGHTHEIKYTIDDDTTFFFESVESNVEAYREGFKAFVESHPGLPMYYGSGLEIMAFPDACPTNDFLDEICPDVPVTVIDMSQHCILANSVALEMCGINKDTPVPEGAGFYRRENGELTGFIVDAVNLFDPLPQRDRSPEKYRRKFKEYQELANSYGITAIDIAFPTIPAPQAWKVFNEMEKDGELTLRVNCAICEFEDSTSLNAETAKRFVEQLDQGQIYNSDFQRISQTKCFMDGVPEGKTAYLLEPYAPGAGEAPDFRGPSYLTQETLDEFVRIVDAGKYQVQIHTMGDGAARAAVDAYAKAIDANGKRDARHMIAHIPLIDDNDVQRMVDMDIIANMQPMWFYYDPNFSYLEETNLGKERFDSEYHIRDHMDKGLVITGSIDYPVQNDFRPLAGIQVGATQCSPYEGERDDPKFQRNPSQAVTPMEMLTCYTVNGAREMFMDELIGTLEPGKKADMVVLGQNILTCDPKTIVDTKICYTISNGRIVYEA